MGFTTSDWLKGDPVRRRGHSPNPARIIVSAPDDEWAKRMGVAGEIQAERFGGDYQIFYLNESEVNDAVRTLFHSAEPEVRRKLVMSLLNDFSDSELLQFTRELLDARAGVTEAEPGKI